MQDLADPSDECAPVQTRLVLDGEFDQVVIRHSTLDPGGEQARVDPLQCTPVPLVVLEVRGEIKELVIESSIVGPVREATSAGDPCSVGKLIIRDSIVHSLVSDEPAISTRIGEVHLERCTVFGDVTVNRLYASEALIQGLVKVSDNQHGCFRFSAASESPAKRLPPQFQAHLFAGGTPNHFFASRRFGDPDYAQLSETAPDVIVRGAENRTEMGAFSTLFNPIKLDDLKAKVNEFMPFGLIAPVHPRNLRITIMSAKDISRFLFQPQKRYSGVRLQQGRVIGDWDWNESERIDDEDIRRTLMEVVCSKGTPNQGFRVSEVATAAHDVPDVSDDTDFPFVPFDTYDFTIAPGSFYLGGQRFETGPDSQSFLGQSDWLQIDSDAGNLPQRPEIDDLTDENGNPRNRFDLVYLRAWEQCVTAVEDSEIRERALGGPDTSVRIRRMRRVDVFVSESATTCEAAFDELKSDETAPRPGDPSDVPHRFDNATCELVSKAKLTVAPANGGPNEDPCTPKVETGFVGADNQTIRIELTATDRFIWGVDNASPYYRVQVLSQDGELVKIKFLTLPRDQQSQPLKGQAVEIHPVGALLANREKVAELQGHLATVETSFNPENGTLTISDRIPEAWISWFKHPDHAAYLSERDPDGQQKYFYLRLWTGGSGDGDAPDIAFTPGDPVELAGTGLEVNFSDYGLPGDHWIIAARPNTPQIVVPWELLEQAPPAGLRSFLAPLALIRWSLETGPGGEQVVQPSVHDCRAKFSPLCDVRGCCTVTVGDGIASTGDVQSIQDAVDTLPAEGGEICVLPGVHRANVTITRKGNIRIHGCGKQTVVIPRTESPAAAIFRIVDSSCISLERMDMATLEGTAVEVGGTAEIGSSEIEIGHNRIAAYREGVHVDTTSDVTIHYNRIRMLDTEGAGVGIVVAAEDALIERNDVGVMPAGQTPPEDDPGGDPDPTDPCEEPENILGNASFLLRFLGLLFVPLVPLLVVFFGQFRALGGIWIGAGSERIKVRDNVISGGSGNGVTLGGRVEPLISEGNGETGPEHVIESEGDSVQGFVREDTTGRNDISIDLVRDDGTVVNAVSGDGGYFFRFPETGTYKVSSVTPNWKIESVSTVDSFEFGRFHNIDIAPEEQTPDVTSGFLYDVQIERKRHHEHGPFGHWRTISSGCVA